MPVRSQAAGNPVSLALNVMPRATLRQHAPRAEKKELSGHGDGFRVQYAARREKRGAIAGQPPRPGGTSLYGLNGITR